MRVYLKQKHQSKAPVSSNPKKRNHFPRTILLACGQAIVKKKSGMNLSRNTSPPHRMTSLSGRRKENHFALMMMSMIVMLMMTMAATQTTFATKKHLCGS
jgi:hypothetical protein